MRCTGYSCREGSRKGKVKYVYKSDSVKGWCQTCFEVLEYSKELADKTFNIVGEENNEMNNNLMKWAKLSNCWELAELAVKSVSRVMLWGLPGTAKTTFGLNQNERRYSITLSEDYTVQELLGHYVPRGQVFEWHNGPVTRAWLEGSGLILNELGRASGPVLDVMLGVLDDPSIAEMALPTGEIIKPKKGFKVVATSNSAPHLMDPALVDRFDAIIEITEPHPMLIQHLNQEIPGLGTSIKNTYTSPDTFISPRRALAFVQYHKAGVNKRQAAVLAFGDKAQDFLAASAAVGA